MSPQSAAIAGSGKPLKSRFESEIRAKIFSKSADPFAYSLRSRNRISPGLKVFQDYKRESLDFEGHT